MFEEVIKLGRFFKKCQKLKYDCCQSEFHVLHLKRDSHAHYIKIAGESITKCLSVSVSVFVKFFSQFSQLSIICNFPKFS